MSSFPILDLIVGIIFIYFLLSIICSSIVEMMLTDREVRGKVLGKWLVTIFNEKVTNSKNEGVRLGKEIMDHAAVTGLSDKGKAPPYIDSKNFVSVLLDKIHANSSNVNPTSIDEIIESINTTSAVSDDLKRSFLISANEAKDTFNALTIKTSGAIEMFRNKMENWYDSNMQRLTGSLKKYSRRFTFVAAIIVTVLVNADTIEISKYLYNNPEAAKTIAAKAYETANNEEIKQEMERKKLATTAQNDTVKLTIQQADSSIKANRKIMEDAKAVLKASFPLGWANSSFSESREWYEWILFWLAKLIGMALTVVAIMMGAPFWFEILNKVSNIRGSGKKPNESVVAK